MSQKRQPFETTLQKRSEKLDRQIFPEYYFSFKNAQVLKWKYIYRVKVAAYECTTIKLGKNETLKKELVKVQSSHWYLTKTR